ncbi:MAG: hypothetical protein CVU03_02760 [Bacteroidetes bacterium HGW-Bacteroidetes-2]|jgi:hypothetical protein|nr:MAG: hypothetical protein CVU03_02760 [Bacteroidetes bacterium HGW-Bacteroidetes-2]
MKLSFTNIFVFFLLFISCNTKAQQDSLSKGATLLFKEVTSKLSISEKNSIYALTTFKLSNDENQFCYDGAEDFPFDAFVYPLDLNADGVEEIAILFGNSYTSGFAGNSSILYIKNNNDDFIANFGFPGFLMVATTKNNIYPDILIDTPTSDAALWKWNGVNYDFAKTLKKDKNIFASFKNVYEWSEIYQESLKK